MFKKISKFLLQLLIVTGLISTILCVSGGGFTALAAEQAAESSGYLTLPSSDKYGNIVVAPPGDSAQEMIVAVLERAIGYAKVLVGIVAIFLIVAMGAKIATSSGNEESVTKATKGLMYSIAAFAIISLSGEIGRLLGFFDQTGGTFGGQSNGGIIGTPGQILERVHLFDKQVEIVIVFIKYLIGAIAVAMVVINGVKLVAGGGEEENIKKARNGIIYALGGLLTMYFANIVVNKIFYKLDKDIYSGLEGVTPVTDLKEGLGELVGVTNFIVSFVGPILFLLLLVGGAMYLSSGGDEEKMNKAKRLIISALIGVIVIYGAFAIISTVISGSFQEVTSLTL